MMNGTIISQQRPTLSRLYIFNLLIRRAFKEIKATEVPTNLLGSSSVTYFSSSSKRSTDISEFVLFKS